MNKKERQKNFDTRLLLERIIGHEIPPTFGEPLITAFGNMFTEAGKESITGAAMICMLYISCTETKMPQSFLRTFYTNLKEEVALFVFDCKKYDKIFELIPNEELSNVNLLNEQTLPQTIRLTKEALFESFDFYTNQ